MRLPFLLFFFCVLFAFKARAQQEAVTLAFGYQYNPDEFYLSPAELDSNFIPEQGLKFSASLTYENFFGVKRNWIWMLRLTYSYRSIPYSFKTPDTGDEQFRGNLQGRYLDLGAGAGQKILIDEAINLTWNVVLGYGIPLQKDTITTTLPPYPIRLGANYLPYADAGIGIERIFSSSDKGFWKIGLEPVLRFYTRPLYNYFPEEKSIFSYGFTVYLGYVIL